MQENEIQCQYAIGAQTLRTAYRLYLKQNPGRLGVRMVLGGILLSAALVEYFRGASAPVIYTILALAGIYFLVSPLVWKTILASKATAGGEVKLTLSDKGIEGKVRETPIQVEWKDLSRFEELEAGIYTEWQDGAFLWLDAEGFQDAAWRQEARSWAGKPVPDPDH
ncbi:MAG: hypothetical protein AAGA58_14870 [Verrucomicrobiota bacterium]